MGEPDPLAALILCARPAEKIEDPLEVLALDAAAVVLDLIAHVGTCLAVAGAGISGSMVLDIMLEAVERRFAARRSLYPLEWLTDSGSALTSKEIRDRPQPGGERASP